MTDTVTTLPGYLYRDLMELPFVEGARGPDAVDCWGLLQIVQHRLGRRPTDFPSQPDSVAAALADEWVEVKRALILPGDAILLRSTQEKYEWHVGVMVTPYIMLHAREEANVCLERIDSLAYARRIVGFYRFRG